MSTFTSDLLTLLTERGYIHQVTDAGAFPIRKMPVRVARLERLSHDVMGITLQLPAGRTPLQAMLTVNSLPSPQATSVP